MFQLHLLSGRAAGTICLARRFPFRVGRNPACDLVADEPGVWDDHVRFELNPAEGLRLYARAEAPVILNGSTVVEARVRNGDRLEIGGLKLQFWLAEAPLRSQRAREWVTWLLLGMLFVAQAALIYWLR